MAKRRPSGDGMVRKRENGRWEGRIVVGHKNSGEPIFRSVYAKTQKELLHKLHREIDIYQDAELTEDSLMTLGEWLDQWLDEYAKATVRYSTIVGYQKVIGYIKPVLGDKQISSITTDDVQRMYRRLREHGRVHKHPEYDWALAPTTVHHVHTTLHLAMDAAVREHLIARNPTVNAVPPKAEPAPKRILSETELDRFMTAIEADEIWHDFFYTEMTTGMRRGEICGLLWTDFDEKVGTLKIQRTIHMENGRPVAGPTKTGRSARTLLLPNGTIEVLRERKKKSCSAWIFPNPTSPELPLSPNTAYHRLKTILRKAGLPDIRFHDLRHTFSTHALTNGVDAKTLSGILGHTNASFTLDTYTHVTGDMQKRAAEVVGDFMEDIFGKELKPRERNKNAEMAPSI